VASALDRRKPDRRRRLARLAAGLAILVAAAVAIVAALGGGTAPGALLAESYARAWSLREWAPLYADLDARSRGSLRFAGFAARERRELELATSESVGVGAASALSGRRYAVPVSLRTRIFGTLHERFVLTVAGPSGAPRIRWGAPAGFPGLDSGEQLRRTDTAPARGILLARNGVALSEVPAASNMIGTVGTAGGTLLAQMIAEGFPASTPVGLDGLELLFQHRLGGTPGGSLYAGRRLLASSSPHAGRNVRTSISPSLQALAVAELGASSGGIVVMEPSTGEVLAAAGEPLSELQPPGSTFKIVTLTAVLEAHLATAGTLYAYATSTVLDGFTLHNANGESCGGTLTNAFAVSCNSVFAPLGARLGASRLVSTAGAYGFNASSPVSIAAESTLPPASLTDDLQLGESAIGQAQVLASPLQMARVAATIALVGRRPVPTFAIVAPRRFPRVIPVAVARTVRALMRDVVSYGTGTSAQIPGVVVAGKTGTAEVVTPVACGATGASGVSGVTGTGSPVAGAASVAAAHGRRASDSGASAHASEPIAHASGTGGATAPAGGTGATGSTGSAGGGGSGGVNAPTGPAGATTTTTSTTTTTTTTTSTSTTSGSSGSSGSSGPTGATGCGTDTNPYDTDAWFVAFAPEIRPRFVVAVLLPHDGAGGTTAAPPARAILEQALASGA
jgi:hypothetical protein